MKRIQTFSGYIRRIQLKDDAVRLNVVGSSTELSKQAHDLVLQGRRVTIR